MRACAKQRTEKHDGHLALCFFFSYSVMSHVRGCNGKTKAKTTTSTKKNFDRQMSGAQSKGVHLAFSSGYQGGFPSSILSWTPQKEGGAEYAQSHRDGISHACCCKSHAALHPARAARRPAGVPLHELRAARYLARTARHEACTARVYVCVRERVCVINCCVRERVPPWWDCRKFKKYTM